jgi:hypothetical protein
MCHIYLVQICADWVSQQLDILLAFISDGWRERAEVEFLEEIQTEVLRVFLLAIHRHL